MAMTEEEEGKKKAVFDQMRPRNQAHILKKGYDKWDPFLVPKDPIDIRKDATSRTTQQLVREFLQERQGDAPSHAFSRGVLELALGIVNNEERFIGMFEFAAWYQRLLEREKGGK
ncbi:MAG: hypothetical protein HZB23_13490 [Deltaproteobacteria bacterium]|nr:hypothetical protein [Deltaproteobacteria bacterium]